MTTTLTVLTLAPDNVSNTSISTENGALLYKVETTTVKSTFGTNIVTRVYSASGSELASLEWHDFRDDKATVGDKKQMAIGKWLKKGGLGRGSTVTFEDDTGRKYRWEGYTAYVPLELYADDTSQTNPIAQFKRSTPADGDAGTGSKPVPAKLLMTERALEIRDTVVISFLFLEKRRRMMDNKSKVFSIPSDYDLGWGPGGTVPG